MDGWNPPNDLTTDFNENVENNNRNNTQNQSTTTVTAAEKKQLENEREQPVLEQNLQIGGAIEQNVHNQVAQQREERINHIAERLNNAQQKFQENFKDGAKRPFKLTDDFNRASRGRRD